MRISDWSSDVCSSDLALLDGAETGEEEIGEAVADRPKPQLVPRIVPPGCTQRAQDRLFMVAVVVDPSEKVQVLPANAAQSRPVPIGRASCRERECQYVEI